MQPAGVSFSRLNDALVRRDRVAINGILSQWLILGADVGDRWHLFADILAQNGEWSLALNAIERHRALFPDDPNRRFADGVMQARAGRHDDARSMAELLTKTHPNNVRFQHFAGTLASEAGLFDLATHHFLATLEAVPASAQTWLELSAIHRFVPGDELFERLRKVADARHPSVASAPLCYALGKALDDMGEIDDAFQAFAAGASRVAIDRAYDAETHRDAVGMLEMWNEVVLPPPTHRLAARFS